MIFTKVADWIASQGFQVDYVPKSRTYISFSGTAAQVRDAFNTEIHRYIWRGKPHFANIRDVAIPIELEPLVYSIVGLDDLREKPAPPTRPHLTNNDGSHALTPGDLAVIYNLVPLHKHGLTGAGQKVVVVGESALNLD